MTHYTNPTAANINSAAARLAYKPSRQPSEAERLARYLEEMQAFSWTQTWQDAQARLAELEAQG